MATEASYGRELEVARAAAETAGAVLMRYAERGARYGLKASNDGGRELVSEADLEADRVLQREILECFPGDGWLSEERHDDGARLSEERVWIVDPLDGTREFLMGMSEFSVSIALVVRGAPVLGVVYNPAEEEMFAAAQGAPLDPRLVLAPATGMAEALVLTGHGEWYARELPPLPVGTRVMRVGSIAYRMALLSSGTGGLIFTAGERSEWDVAAGAALLLAAGATVTDLDGAVLRFNRAEPKVRGLIAGRPAVHADALALWDEKGWPIGWP